MLKRIIKRITIVVFLLLIFSTNKIYARNIKFYSKVLEAMDGIPFNAEYPAFVYRTYTSAAKSTRDRYYCQNVSNSKCLDVSDDGWVYIQKKQGTVSQKNLDYLVIQRDESGNIKMPGSGTSRTTFRTWSTYFHPNANTLYSDTSGDLKYQVYESSASDETVESIQKLNEDPQNISYIESETENYKGLYDQAAIWGQVGSQIPDDGSRYENGIYEILEDQNFMWRMKVEGTSYVSDMLLNPDHYKYIYNLFSNQISGNQPIYVSSNVYSKGGTYTQEGIDTAYKFYKNLSWWGGNTIYGGSKGQDSFINYYDNFMYFPKTENTTIYVRHIDVTGEEVITNDVANSKSRTSKFKKVGYGYKNDTVPVWPTEDPEYPEYKEKFILKAEDLEENDIITIYNKLYNETTRTRTDGDKEVDSTDYTDYSLIGTVVGIGGNMSEATENRKEKYDNNIIEPEQTFEVDKEYFGQYIVIDFLYKKIEPPPTEKSTLLVRHINVSGMTDTNYREINTFVNNGTIGSQVFDGYNKLTDSWNKIINVTQCGKVKYNNTGIYYNEIYSNLNPNRTYELYNEFYNNTNSDYEYIGYIMNYNNYDLYLAELSRNDKIKNINFSDLNTLDGTGNVNIVIGNSKFIVVDMYYKVKDTYPIRFASVTGRLSFDSVLSDFTGKTNGNYDKIPSDEDMYASITSANKYIMGGIRIVPMNIQNTQKVKITVNVPYSYTYTYWSSTSCTSGHNRGSQSYGSSCGVKIASAKYDDEGNLVSPAKYCSSRVTSKNYSTNTSTDTITKTFEYNLPYTYDYYKVSNMRVYKIDHMMLDDTENTTDLPLFDGNIHEMGTSQNYKDSVVGSFTSSSSSQVLKDARSVDNISISTANNETIKQLTETVTVSTVVFPTRSRFSDKLYTKSTASTKFYNNYVEYYIESISDKITQNTAPTITSASSNGNITNTTASNGAIVEFTVSNDRINIGAEDMLAKTSNARSVSTTVNLETYKDTDKNKKHDSETKLETSYPDNVYKQYGFDKNITLKTSRNDFIQTNDTALHIPMTRLNGERISKAKIYYKLIADSAINFDVSDTTSKKHDWTRTSATSTGSFMDTEMNKEDGKKVETRIMPGANLPETISYSYKSSKTSTLGGSGDVVNVFTPIKFSVSLDNGQTTTNQTIVDHTTGEQLVSSSSERIQKDTRFTITIKPENSHETYGALGNGINKYINCYYIKFEDLDVQEILINGQLYKSGSSVRAGTWIGPITNLGNNTTISAITREDPNDATSVLVQKSNKYVVRGVTKNATNSMLNDLLDGDDYRPSLVTKSASAVAQNTYSTSSSDNTLYHTEYYVKRRIYNDNDFVAETTSVPTKNLSRVYDFKVTDVKDIDWKDTFRKSTTTNTNVHSGIVYYSGVNKWDIYTTTFNRIIRRTTDEIGATSQRTLPVGPYKNINGSYVYAPKLGYRFSFDFKTTGQIIDGNSKTAKIKVSFMFIDKTAGLSPEERLIENIDLYYKNSSNKYVKVGTAEDKTTLYFVPNDGYRLTYMESTYNFKTDSLSSKTVKLGTLKELNLNSKMRAVSDNNFNQIWYGEYKLPNSTIAVKQGETDLNKKLTNGYIAVKFDIEVTDKYDDGTSLTIEYNQKDKAATNKTNTSQWDYEGYLGYNNSRNIVTSEQSLQLRLDSGVIWNIYDYNIATGNNVNLYQKLKGTVMLYDVDAKASSDYN